MITTLTSPHGSSSTSSLKDLFRKGLMLFASLCGHGNISGVKERQEYEGAILRHSAMIERICFGYANSVADLEDLRQDALLNLWEAMPKFKGDCSVKTWIYRITLNSCVSTLRKSYRKVKTVQLSELYDTIDFDEDYKSVVAELHDAIARLNPIDKAIMLLWLEEESYEDIARITGITKSNVAVRIHRSKEKLKTNLKARS